MKFGVKQIKNFLRRIWKCSIFNFLLFYWKGDFCILKFLKNFIFVVVCPIVFFILVSLNFEKGSYAKFKKQYAFVLKDIDKFEEIVATVEANNGFLTLKFNDVKDCCGKILNPLPILREDEKYYVVFVDCERNSTIGCRLLQENENCEFITYFEMKNVSKNLKIELFKTKNGVCDFDYENLVGYLFFKCVLFV